METEQGEQPGQFMEEGGGDGEGVGRPYQCSHWQGPASGLQDSRTK